MVANPLPAFKKVYAVDISAENLEIAKKLYPEFTNVEYDRINCQVQKQKCRYVMLVFVLMLFLLMH